MKIAISNSRDVYYNLSLEEILLKDESIKEDVLLLYINDNAIIFGRNQNVHEEINSDYVNEHKMKLYRRISGGGAVYHDGGNLSFSFITERKKQSYEAFLRPIIDFLISLGLDAKFQGKNDLTVEGMKVSGNAQYIYKDRMFHHGTLLFDANLEILGDALKVNKLKLKSKGIKSARQRVSNIKSLLKEDMTTIEFRDKLVNHFLRENSIIDINNYKLDEIKALLNVRKSDDWIYSKNPQFNIVNEKRFDGGTIKALIDVVENKITHIKFTGDFLSSTNTELIEEKFIGQQFKDSDIETIINGIEQFDLYFGKIQKEELIELVKGE